MAGLRLPGPLCEALVDRGWIDSGTSCRQATPPPGPLNGKSKSVDPLLESLIKARYLGHARQVSYAMQAKSLVGDDSFLGGKFLRMYLDGELDQEVADEAGQEIAATKTYRRLAARTNQRIQFRVNKRLRRLPTEKEVADIARQFLQQTKKKKGIAFRGPLNPVIGGVGDIDVGPVARFVNRREGIKGTQIDYELDVTISDEYDFDNERSGEYDVYRKRLARLLLENEFWEFDKAYFAEVQPVDAWQKTKIGSAGIFASFMYALEKRGWTPGPLPWKTTVVMRGTILRKTKPAKKKMKKKVKKVKRP